MSIQGSCCQPGEFCFLPMSPCNEIVYNVTNHRTGTTGTIKRKWDTWARSLVREIEHCDVQFTNADTFTVTFPPDSTLHERILLLAATLLINIMYFEQHKNNDSSSSSSSFDFDDYICLLQTVITIIFHSMCCKIHLSIINTPFHYSSLLNLFFLFPNQLLFLPSLVFVSCKEIYKLFHSHWI